ncbi:unnamed protein product [Dibothriocephalus latus]|uniref:Uncharacterized protein n=1 Tax=Dibothriocephalus latus TaxID=60516 RepID=A0A3P7NB33_DIBLA|nr:unnamed protein product [Dibothriocephalus latus]
MCRIPLDDSQKLKVLTSNSENDSYKSLHQKSILVVCLISHFEGTNGNNCHSHREQDHFPVLVHVPRGPDSPIFNKTPIDLSKSTVSYTIKCNRIAEGRISHLMRGINVLKALKAFTPTLVLNRVAINVSAT